MKRYNSVYEGVYTKPNEMVEEPNGDWVRWEDVQREYHSEWVTDRRPNADRKMVWNARGVPTFPELVKDGEPWKPIPHCEPYVKPRRFLVTPGAGEYFVYDSVSKSEVADTIPTREAAERIAAIYEEVMP